MKNIMLSCMVLLLIMNTASSQTANKNEALIYERDYDLVTENKTLLVVKIEINEEDINKYKIENKKAFIEHCSKLVDLQNAILWNAVQQHWTLNEKIEFKTISEIKAIAEGDNASNYLVFGQYTIEKMGTPDNPRSEARFEEAISYSISSLDLDEMPSTTPLSWFDSVNYYHRGPIAGLVYLSLFPLEKLKFTKKSTTLYEYKQPAIFRIALDYIITPEDLYNPLVKYVNDRITDAKENKTITDEIYFTQKKDALKDLTLALPETYFADLTLMPKRWQEDFCTKEQFKDAYPYKYEILPEAEYLDLVKSKAKGYAIINFAGIRNNADLFITNLNTQELVLVTRPPYKVDNDLRVIRIKNNQLEYLKNVLNGLESK